MSNYKIDIKDASSNTQTFNLSIPLYVGDYRIKLNTANSSTITSSGDVITVNENENRYKVTFNLTDGTSITPDTVLVTDRAANLISPEFSMDIRIVASHQYADVTISNLIIYNPNSIKVQLEDFVYVNNAGDEYSLMNSSLQIDPHSRGSYNTEGTGFPCTFFGEVAGYIYMDIIPANGSYDPSLDGYLYNGIVYHSGYSESDSFGDPNDTTSVTSTDTLNPNVIVDSAYIEG